MIENITYLEALEKNDELIYDLFENRKTFLGIGTNKTKRRLNKLAKCDPIAHSYRIALEIEDISIQAKKCYGSYRERKYEQKANLILDLIDICKNNNFVCGYQESDNYSCNYVLYFELPHTEQISWHSITKYDLPLYNKNWDGKINSTLSKLEFSISKILLENNLL